MLDEFLKYIQENKIINKGDRVLLAVSGGIDSMVMAHLFIKAGIGIGIAHCNFCLRGEESELDEDLVKELAGENRIPFYSKRFATKDYASEKGISVQMAARELRYEWFETIRKENKFDCIAVAHNLNDNIETLLINLTRGTGITGLIGMKPVSNKVVRPLLFATREKITGYCIANRIAYREDKSNAETKYTRNKIRHLVIPVLKEINPSIEETLNETAERLSGIHEIVSEFINGVLKHVSIKKNKTIVFDIDKLKDLHVGKAVIFELFRPFGITGASSGDLIRILAGRSGSQVFTRTHRIIKNRNEIIVCHLETDRNQYFEINDIEDLSNTPGILWSEIITNIADFKIPEDQFVACLDYEKIKFPLIIRKWEKGDYFYPLGMKQRKKLSDYFVDRKFSLVRKEQALILESEGKITWIVGERIDERFRVTLTTLKILRIQAVRP
jgi:tRNA(Ile)-lysidine synthase